MKKFILIGIILGMLVISACTTSDTGPDSTNTYLGGTQGLTVEFAPGAPPDTVTDLGGDQQFDIVVNIVNMGEAFVDRNDAWIKIKGFRPQDFNLDPSEQNPEDDIEPRRKNPDGSIVEPPMVQTLFENLQYQYVEPGNQVFPVIADVCYLYETNVATSLCIKEDLTSTDPDDLCQVSSSRVTSTSGAPVQVTKINQAPAGRDKTSFTFTISNLGTGDIYKKGDVCTSKTQFENKVYVTIENLLDRGADAVKCVGLREGASSAEGFITLPNGAPTNVYCTVTMTDRNDRIQPFNINLEYDYNEIVEKTLVVEYTPEDY